VTTLLWQTDFRLLNAVARLFGYLQQVSVRRQVIGASAAAAAALLQSAADHGAGQPARLEVPVLASTLVLSNRRCCQCPHHLVSLTHVRHSMAANNMLAVQVVQVKHFSHLAHPVLCVVP
jgi:hypothetical protein